MNYDAQSIQNNCCAKGRSGFVRNHRGRVVYLSIRCSGGRNIQTVRSRSRYKVKRECVVLDHAHKKIHSGIKGNRKLVSEKSALELGAKH